MESIQLEGRRSTPPGTVCLEVRWCIAKRVCFEIGRDRWSVVVGGGWSVTIGWCEADEDYVVSPPILTSSLRRFEQLQKGDAEAVPR